MSQRIHILAAGGSLAGAEDRIRTVSEHALQTINAVLPVFDVDIVFWACPPATIPHLGIGGRTADAHVVFVTLNPQHPRFAQTVREEIPRTLAHELHHCKRMRGPGYGETLAEALISEGLADHFDIEVWGKELQLWSTALTDEDAAAWLAKARAELDKKPYNHAAWFFGSVDQKIPRWTGYSLGFRLVRDYLHRHPEQTAATLHAMPATAFL